MSGDETLAQALGARLREEVADIEAAPGLGAVIRRRHVRRAWAYRAAIAAPTAVAVAALAAGLTAQRQPADADAQLRNVAYVTTHTVEALDRMSTSVFWEHTDWSDLWSDLTTGRTLMVIESNGARTRAELSSGGSNLVVDYTRRIWWTEDSRVPAPSGSTPPNRKMRFLDPQHLRDELAAGDIRVVGTTTVDGRKLVRLQMTVPNDLGNRSEMWVDPSTFLPNRSVDYTANKVDGVFKYQWLTRNQQHLDLIRLEPPAGFTHVPRDPGTTGKPGSSPTS